MRVNQKSIRLFAKLAIVLATLIWGSSFFIMKDTLDSVDMPYLLAIRFSVATIILSAVFVPRFRNIDITYIRDGAIFGALIFLGYVIQSYGLMFTTPGKNAFLTAAYCLIVPLYEWVFKKNAPGKTGAIASALCVCGIALISLSNGDLAAIGKGDALSLLCAFFFAAHIFAVSSLAKGRDIILLTIIQFASAAVLAWIYGAFFGVFPTSFSKSDIMSIAYLSVFATAATLLLQNLGQKYLPSSTVALLLSLEAVFGVVFSVAFFGETLTGKLILGFSLIFGAILISEGTKKEA